MGGRYEKKEMAGEDVSLEERAREGERRESRGSEIKIIKSADTREEKLPWE